MFILYYIKKLFSLILVESEPDSLQMRGRLQVDRSQRPVPGRRRSCRAGVGGGGGIEADFSL